MPQAQAIDDTQALRTALIYFYDRRARSLPWRARRDAYGIWLSEIMLQQTQVDTVVPRYLAFVARFPSLEALAAARVEAVCEAWAGLGYYRRARHLHLAAQRIVAEHAGQMPRELGALLALPGIGRYTAGAIASIAFGIEAPIVDGNVARVFARLYMMAHPAASPAGQKALWALATDLVEGERPGDLNQALMELGATVCTPKAPNCPDCPVQSFCGAWANQSVASLPAPVVRKAPKAMSVAFAYVAEPQGVWLVRRPVTAGLWAGLWELPSADGIGAKAKLSALLGRPLGQQLGHIEHRLTHRQVTATVYRASVATMLAKTSGACGAPGILRSYLTPSADMRLWQDPLQAPLSTLARRAIEAAQTALNP